MLKGAISRTVASFDAELAEWSFFCRTILDGSKSGG